MTYTLSDGCGVDYIPNGYGSGAVKKNKKRLIKIDDDIHHVTIIIL